MEKAVWEAGAERSADFGGRCSSVHISRPTNRAAKAWSYCANERVLYRSSLPTGFSAMLHRQRRYKRGPSLSAQKIKWPQNPNGQDWLYHTTNMGEG